MTNEDRYKTPEERVMEFRNYCNPIVGNCGTRCRLSEPDKDGGHDMMKCFAYWLSIEAEEKPDSCPFCYRETMSRHLAGGFCVECDCGYTSPFAETEAAAVAAHNRVYKAMKNANVHEQVKIDLLNIANNGSKTTVAEIVKRYYTVKA